MAACLCEGAAGRGAPPRDRSPACGRVQPGLAADRLTPGSRDPVSASRCGWRVDTKGLLRRTYPAPGRVQPGHTVDRPPPGARAPAPARAGAGTEDRGSLLQRTAHVLPGTRPFGRGAAWPRV